MANELSPNSVRYIGQLGTLREVDASSGPEGPAGVTAYWLVPTSGYHNGERFPHEVSEELKDGSYDKTTVDGVEFYKVPEESSNLPGRLSHYAQLTGVAELQNPPSGGVNRVVETFDGNSASASVAPDAVQKYVEDHDSYEDARKKSSEEDERVGRAVTRSPGREPAEGKLVVGSPEGENTDDKPKRGKQPGEKEVKPTE